jgi:hypothetical protein
MRREASLWSGLKRCIWGFHMSDCVPLGRVVGKEPA